MHEDFWRRVSDMRRVVEGNSLLIWVALGAAGCRIAFGWALSLARTGLSPWDAPITAHHVVIVGELVGWLFLLLRCRCGRDVAGCPPVVLTSFASMACGAVTACLCASGAVSSPWLGVAGPVGCLLIGFGRATTMLLWLDVLRLLAPRMIALCVSAVYVIDLAAYWFIERTDDTACLAACLATVAGSCALFLCQRGKGIDDEPRAASRDRAAFPMRTLVWCVAFSLAYGLGSGYTGLGNSSMEMHVGYAIPAAALVVLATAVPNRFDLRGVFAVALVMMTAGLLTILVADGFAGLTQVLMSTALACVYILMFTLVVSRARDDGRRVCSECAGLLIASSVAIQAAKTACDAAMAHGMVPLVTGMLLLVVMLGYLAVGGERTWLRIDRPPAAESAGREESRSLPIRLQALVGGCNLTERELAVYELLAQGMGVQAISDALFIAPSTVRAHASRIYEKLGVHSRQEFDALVMKALAARH